MELCANLAEKGNAFAHSFSPTFAASMTPRSCMSVLHMVDPAHLSPTETLSNVLTNTHVGTPIEVAPCAASATSSPGTFAPGNFVLNADRSLSHSDRPLVSSMRAAAQVRDPAFDHRFEGVLHERVDTLEQREAEMEQSFTKRLPSNTGWVLRGTASWVIEEKVPARFSRLRLKIDFSNNEFMVLAISASDFVDLIVADKAVQRAIGEDCMDVTEGLEEHEFHAHLRHIDCALVIEATESRAFVVYHFPTLLFHHFLDLARMSNMHDASCIMETLHEFQYTGTSSEDQRTRTLRTAELTEYLSLMPAHR